MLVLIAEMLRVSSYFTNRVLLKLNVLSNKKHGYTDFDGPECRRILKGIPTFQSELELFDGAVPSARAIVVRRQSKRRLAADADYTPAPPRKRSHFTPRSHLPMPSETAPEPSSARVRRPTHPSEALPDLPPTAAGRMARISRIIDAMQAFARFCVLTMRPQRAPDEEWKTALNAVNSAIADLELRVSMKIHLLNAHVEDFLTQHAAGLSFCAYTEQAFESSHRYFMMFLKNNNVPNDFARLAPASVLRSVIQWAGTRFTADQYSAAARRDARMHEN